MKKIIVVSTIALAGCGQYENPVSDFTIGNRLPLEIRPAQSPPPAQSPVPSMGNGDEFHPDRSYWYPSYGPVPICPGCESIIAYVANNTGVPQRIGIAVYKHLSNGSNILYSREYGIIQPNNNPNNNLWQQLLIINGSPLTCPFSVYISQIDVNFNPFYPNADTDGFLIATYTGNPTLSCNN